ncbi:Single-strand DNA binding protein [Bifidobacterium saguini DSM 23967]|uniref:Single-stranded DNA-binding protein n=3 Tax=Bifidobacterium TaxID=1678 RepID=A0A2N5ISC8_9BIFI|nr:MULTISPECIES: single-stranded DNA-binding protein [Bifidobacterium]KFI92756.1 Single-strand DNA binding protein [Bifidobacterium saguini DSM 23967]PLS24851.1 single-stranded DNA-binding protein [Bifidobacterium imperatoris]QSY58556.1 single-stranded DNA-binding protein [Bifidobacterium imperatoris]QTB91762.1 single-stranded DNA-binding protein [Bifidobacterium saguini]
MAGETIITVVGNLTRDPELRTIGSGSTVVNFTIAASTRQYNRNTNQWEDGDTLFMNCSAWDGRASSLASNIASSLSKGMRVIAQGRLTQRSYQAQDGSQRTVVELRVDEIGPALSRATAQVTRQTSQGGFQGRSGGFQGGQPGQGYGNQGGQGAGNGGYNGGQSGYNGGQSNGGYNGGYQGGAGYSQQPAAPSAPAAPAVDPWSSGSSAGAADSGFTFGGSSEFGGDDNDPEF